MLLAIDVGNSQTVVGVWESSELKAHFRISTNKEETADEIAITLRDLLSLKGFDLKQIDAVIVSSVVPHCTASLKEMADKNLDLEPLIVGPGTKTGMPILYDNPHEVGADRIVNAVAAYELYGGPAVVVDFGTATTFDLVSKKGEYVGGVIAPGVEVSAEALFERAAKLSKVDLEVPDAVIGKNTRTSMQSGIMYGSAGVVDTIIGKIEDEIKEDLKVVATGGLTELIIPACKTEIEVNPLLTLIGLNKIFEKNA